MKNLLKITLLLISIYSFAQSNTTCATATPLTLTVGQSDLISGDYTNVPSTQYNQTCGFGGGNPYKKRLWYSFTMPVDGNIIITNSDLEFTLFTSCSSNAGVCLLNSGYFYNLSAGTTYYLEAYTDTSVTGNKTFKIEPIPVTNDTCATAQSITVSTATYLQVDADTRGSSLDNAMATCENQNIYWHDIWYEFTMPVNGNIRITNTFSENYFTLYDACGGNEIACFKSTSYFYSLTAGNTYYLRFSNAEYWSDNRNFSIQAFETAVNDTCSTAENITVPTNTSLTVNANTQAATISSTNSNCENVNDTLLDLWYSFTMPVNGNIRITNASNQEYFTLYNACNGTEIACFKSSSYFYSLTAGNTYYLRFSNAEYWSDNRNFSIQAFETAVNDTCSTAENITVPTNTSLTVNANTQAATISSTNSNCENVNDTLLDLWYSFTMPVNGNIRITNASNQEYFTLYNACNGTEIACFKSSSYFYSLTAGNTYYLRFSNAEYWSGNHNFNIQAFETAINDTCANSENIFVSTSNYTEVITNTSSATSDNIITNCENTNKKYLDLWYEITMPVNGNISITYTSNQEYFTLYDACNGTEIACFNGNGIFNTLTSGTTYVLRYAKEEFWSGADNFRIQAIETVPNSDCANPINLTVGTYNEYTETKDFTGITASGTLPLPICSDPNTIVDAWYTVQVPNSGKVTIETTKIIGSTLNDTVLQAFSGTCGSLSEIACDNSSGSNNFSRIELTGLTPSDIIYIRAFENGSDNINSYGIFAYDNACASATNWDGMAWSNGTPDATKIAVIDANYNTNSGNLDACMCKISANKNITVNANQYVKLENNLYNYGSIDINHQASFVQVDDNAELLGNGTYNTVIKTTGLQDTNRFTYISSPVLNANLNVLNSWAKMNYLWEFNGDIQDWQHIPDANTPMEIAKGYAIEGETTLDYSTPYVATTNFSGKFNNGVITQQVYYNTGGIDDDNTLVGNPYPSAIQISSLLDGAVNPSINAVYVWTHNSPLIGAGYANDDYIVCSSTNCVSAYAGNDVNNLNGYLASGQGFFVDTSDAVSNTITFNNSMRVTGNNTDFRTPDNQEQLWVNITSELGYFNQLGLSFTQNGTLDFDKKIDAKRLGTYYGLGFYSIGQNNERFAIEDKGIFTEEITIPLGLYINDEQIQNLKISIDHFANLEEVNVYLKDNLTNTIHNLKINDFTFSIAETGIYNNRFELILQRNSLNVNEDNLSDENITVFQNETKDIILKSSKTIKKVKIYNLLGKLLKEKNINNTNGKIKLLLPTSEVLVLQIQLKSGEIVNQKMIYHQ